MRYGDTPLTREPLPPRLCLAGETYHLRKVLKVDTWAANYLLQRDADCSLHVLKLARLRWAPLRHLSMPLPLQTAHEAELYRRLAGVQGVPRLTGRPSRHSFLHEWIPGEPICRGRALPAGFFGALTELLQALHGRGLAYVDLEKEENVLVGDDDRPYLIDFQISLASPRWLVRIFQSEDLRHLAKHRLRLESSASRETRESVRQRSGMLRLHRLLTRPYFALRRRLQRHRIRS